ncbi:hypothetical protein LSM04_006331 [Trypanosoma melophagium]|uniref:uncharacterized protein n=1 Tax=Trypanosoma melophagium TaxID=715481 RepID=UPI00351A084A|nr:hypothetical protein LSM04_006331 [Trypanosoma melophagium]
MRRDNASAAAEQNKQKNKKAINIFGRSSVAFVAPIAAVGGAVYVFILAVRWRHRSACLTHAHKRLPLLVSLSASAANVYPQAQQSTTTNTHITQRIIIVVIVTILVVRPT